MEDVIESSTSYHLPLEPVKPCTLMGLPIEVRNKILGHLLPNALVIPEDHPFDEMLWSPSLYRPHNEACYTSVLRVNHQVYTEGTALLYNRAFRVIVTHQGIISTRGILASNWLQNTNRVWTFPFYRAKQIQIELWATDFRYDLFDLRLALSEICGILSHQPSLKNVRIDLYDESYQPKKPLSSGNFDDDEPHPPQDKSHCEMAIFPEEEDPEWDGGIDPRLWGPRSGIPANTHTNHGPRIDPSTLEDAMQCRQGSYQPHPGSRKGPRHAENRQRVSRCDDEQRRLGRRLGVHGLVWRPFSPVGASEVVLRGRAIAQDWQQASGEMLLLHVRIMREW